VPSFYCGCKACEEARENPRAARDCAGLLITGSEHTLIDTPPELRTQLIREGISTIDRVLFTHEHFDHTGGLPQLEFYVRLNSHAPLPIYGNEETLTTLAQAFPFLSDVLAPTPLETYQTVEFDGIRFTALPAVHGAATFGFLLETPQGFKVAYFPDTGPLAPQILESLKDLDILIIDATFNGSNWMPASHHTIDEAIALAQTLQPKRTYLTHLSMHYDEPITLAELECKLQAYPEAILVAYDGLTIPLI
jgi:phosphoribosyl 1,2-cyclic phosphate phosphodiesterase